MDADSDEGTMSIDIRQATQEDVRRFMHIALNFWKETEHFQFPIDEKKLSDEVNKWIMASNYCFLVAFVRDIPAGILVGHFNEVWYGHDRVAKDQMIYVDETFRSNGIGTELCKAFKVWCDMNNVKTIYLGSSSGLNMNHAEGMFVNIGADHIGNLWKVDL